MVQSVRQFAAFLVESGDHQADHGTRHSRENPQHHAAGHHRRCHALPDLRMSLRILPQKETPHSYVTHNYASHTYACTNLTLACSQSRIACTQSRIACTHSRIACTHLRIASTHLRIASTHMYVVTEDEISARRFEMLEEKLSAKGMSAESRRLVQRTIDTYLNDDEQKSALTVPLIEGRAPLSSLTKFLNPGSIGRKAFR